MVTILYSVPGEASEEKYAAGTSNGSKVEDTKSFKAGLGLKFDSTVVDFEVGFAATSKDGHSIEVKKNQSRTLFVDGTGTTIDHSHDEFYLWTNVEIDLVETGPDTVTQTFRTRDGQPMRIVPVTAAELQNPSLLPPPKKTALAALTDVDRSTILSMDPFFSNEPNLAFNSRLKRVSQLQLDGIDNPGDPLTGQGLDIESEVTKTDISGDEESFKVSFFVGGGFSFIQSSSAKVGFELEFTQETTTENSQGTKQTAEVKLMTGTVGYHGVIDVYEDTLFNSLVFVLVDTPSPNQAMLTGTVHDKTGKPVVNELVTVVLSNGQRRRVFTNAHGIYRIFDAPEGDTRVHVEGRVAAVAIVRSRPEKLDVQVDVPEAVRRP